MYETNVTVSGIAVFLKNKAREGGAISGLNTNVDKESEHTDVQSGKNTKQLYFIDNNAENNGGAMLVWTDNSQHDNKLLLSGHFINNTAGECGGAMHITTMNVVTQHVSVTGNEGSAICLFDSSITFTGATRILDNTGRFGGGIHSERSSITFTDSNTLENNHGLVGGAIYLVHGTLSLGIFTLFLQNRADEDGGALYAVSTDITLRETVKFNYNSANRGGAMYLRQSAGFIFTTSFTLTTASNHAYESGGVIFHKDMATPDQCSFIAGNKTDTFLPRCFYRLESTDDLYHNRLRIYIYTFNNSAGKDGDFLYGGLLDRCQMTLHGPGNIGYRPYEWLIGQVMLVRKEEMIKKMTSQPYQLCFCESNHHYSCSERSTAHIYKGQKLRVSLLALDQTQDSVSTTIKALTSSNARIEPNQDPQILPQQCSSLTYNLFSTASHEQLVLYPDGPCRDSELSRAVIDVTLKPCPDAFAESGDHCVCEERLQVYASCIIADDNYNNKKKVWLQILDEFFLQ